jgi:hypothetical protein
LYDKNVEGMDKKAEAARVYLEDATSELAAAERPVTMTKLML